MGWLFTHDQTRSDLIRERVKNWESEQVKATCLAHTCKGNVLWTVWEQFAKQDIYHDHHVEKVIDGKKEYVNEPKLYLSGGTVIRYIGCDLIAKEKGYGWGYKDMSESMGPYYFSCPLSYLEMVPADKYETNEKWREDVRKHHSFKDQVSEAKRQFKTIDQETQEIIIKLKHGYKPEEFVMSSATPFRGRSNGKLFRIPVKAVESFHIQEIK